MKNKLQTFLVLFFLLYVFMWNLRTTNFNLFAKVFPRKINFIANFLRLDQRWNMFSPYPLVDDGWYVMPGRLKDGTVVDLFRGGERVNYEKPVGERKFFKNERWRKYLMNLYLKEYEEHRPLLANYYCQEWNRKHEGEKQLQNLQIEFMLERTLPNGVAPVRKVTLLGYECP